MPKGAHRIAAQPRGRCLRSYGSASSTRCETAAGSILPLLGVQILLCSRGASPGEKSGGEGGAAGTLGSGNWAKPPGSGVTVDGTGRWHREAALPASCLTASQLPVLVEKNSLGLGVGGSALPGLVGTQEGMAGEGQPPGTPGSCHYPHCVPRGTLLPQILIRRSPQTQPAAGSSQIGAA